MPFGIPSGGGWFMMVTFSVSSTALSIFRSPEGVRIWYSLIFPRESRVILNDGLKSRLGSAPRFHPSSCAPFGAVHPGSVGCTSRTSGKANSPSSATAADEGGPRLCFPTSPKASDPAEPSASTPSCFPGGLSSLLCGSSGRRFFRSGVHDFLHFLLLFDLGFRLRGASP